MVRADFVGLRMGRPCLLSVCMVKLLIEVGKAVDSLKPVAALGSFQKLHDADAVFSNDLVDLPWMFLEAGDR